ncbi:MAG: ATP-binding cassette domain-containing protein [Saprospiraceae bacterium]
MLSTNQLEYEYPGRIKIQFPDINLNDGQHSLIIGKSGSGKTTLLYILAGLLKPTNGVVTIDNQDLYQLSASKLDAFRGSKIAVIFQQPIFIQAVSVFENLAWAQRLAGTEVNKNRILELLHRLQIDQHAHHIPSRLSVGEQQRASIARALVNKPTIVLADEPTSALDDSNAHEVIELLHEQAKRENSSLLVVTHDARVKSLFDQQITIGQ